MSLVERGSGDRPALRRLIPDGETTHFADDYWGVKPLLRRAGAASDFDDLFSAEAVDELVASRAIRSPFVRMAHEGVVLPPGRYTSSGGYGAEIGDQLDSAKVLAEFAAGATLVLQGLHRTWPALADFTRQLDADLGRPCQINAYVTPASSRGFDAHYDIHDVFVMQIAGRKSWTIHEPVHPNPLADQPWSDHREAVVAAAAEKPYLSETFAPGDVLYLPRGWLHSAVAQGGTSIHLTIGIKPHTRFDVVRGVLERAATDAGLRESLPLDLDLSNARALDPVVGETVERLRVWLDAADVPSAAADALASAQTRDSAVAAAPLHPLATVDALAGLGGEAEVAWRPGLRARVVRGATSVEIRLPDKTVALPVEAAEAVDSLATGSAVRADAFAGLDSSSSLVVARRLLREAVLVVA